MYYYIEIFKAAGSIKTGAALWLVFCFLWPAAGLASAAAAAGADENFLSLCAGERGAVSAADLRQALTAGANVNFSGPRGFTPLMAFAASRLSLHPAPLPALAVLLEAGADLTARSEEGGTALGYALLNRAGPSFIAALLKAGADPRTPTGRQTQVSPLALAAGLEPDLLVAALLLTAGAGPPNAEETADLLAMADLNPNPRMRPFLEGALKAAGIDGQPLFAAPPPEPELRALLTELDSLSRPRTGEKGEDGEGPWFDYLRWQIDLPLNVAARRELFGRTETEAWLEEYAFYRAAGGDSPQERPAGLRPRGRFIIPGRTPESPADGGATLGGRRAVALIHNGPADSLLRVYETETGRELWSRRFEGRAYIFRPDEKLLVAAVKWNDRLGAVYFLDPLTGDILLARPGLDDPKWTMDAGRRALIISTDFSLDIFDPAARKNRRQTWRELLDRLPWPEARRAAQARQNEILAAYGESLDEEGRFIGHSGDLFSPNRVIYGPLREQAETIFNERGYSKTLVAAGQERPDLAAAFVMAAFRPGRPEALLALVDTAKNRIDALTLPNDQSPAWNLKIKISGDLLAAETDDDIHFFAVREKARFLGSLSKRVRPADPDAGPRIGALSAVLDDDLARPWLLLNSDLRNSLVAEADLVGGSPPRLIRLKPGSAVNLAAWAAAPDGRLAAALDDGALWRIDPGAPAPLLVAPPSPRRWSALAWAGKAPLLAAASGEHIHLFKPGAPPSRLTLKAGRISRLALDDAGRRLYAALEGFRGGSGNGGSGNDGSGDDGSALALVDLKASGAPLYRETEGRILALRWDGRRESALAVVEEETAASPDRPEPLGRKAQKTDSRPKPPGRWPQGRADFIRFPPSEARLSGDRRIAAPRRLYAGLAPDAGSLFYQEFQTPAVTLNRTKLEGGFPERLTGYGLQAGLNEAAFDPSGRLAVLTESGPASPGYGPPFNWGGAFRLYNLAAGREIARGPAPEPEGLLGAAFFQDSSRLAVFGRQGLIRLWNLSRPEPENFLTWVFLEGGRWAALEAGGLFDSSNPEELDEIYWAAEQDPELARPLNRLPGEHFRPGLAAAADQR